MAGNTLQKKHHIISHISSARFFMFFSADVFGVSLSHDQIRSNTMSWCFVVLSRLASRCPRPSAADPVAFGCTLWLWGVDTISNTNEKHSNKSSKLRNSWKGICMHCMWLIYCRRKFRSQTSDNMDRWKAEQGRGREKRNIRRNKGRRERVRRKKMQMREKVGKSRNTVFFQWFGAPEGRKVGSLKRRVRSQLARWEMKNCTPLWREAHFEVKMHKNSILGPLLEVEMSKKCTPLWREAHFQVKMYKTPQRRSTFGSCDVEKVHAVVARSTFRSQNVQNTPCTDHFWRFRCRKSARRCGAKHILKSKC